MQLLKTVGNGNIDLILNKNYATLRYQTGITEVKCRGNLNLISTLFTRYLVYYHILHLLYIGQNCPSDCDK